MQLIIILLILILPLLFQYSKIKAIYDEFFPKATKKQKTVNVPKSHVKEEKENRIYRYKVKAKLYYKYPDINEIRFSKETLLSSNIYECPKEEAFEKALNATRSAYDNLETVKTTELSDQCLHILFNDGLEYWLKEPETVLFNDNNTFRSLRKANRAIKEVLSK